MALWDKLKAELLDIVEWLDSTNDTLAYRFERYQNEIKYGAKLVVREGQMAAFVNEGKLADVYKPGTYELVTQNMPILTTLRGWKYGFNSPFKAEIYFISTRKFTDLKWGTPGPATMRDKEFGMVRVTAFGLYSIRAKDPAIIIRDLVGTDDRFTTQEIQENLRGKVGRPHQGGHAGARHPGARPRGQGDRAGQPAEGAPHARLRGLRPRAGRDPGAGHRPARGGREGDRQARRHRGRGQPAGVHAVRDRLGHPRRREQPGWRRGRRRGAWARAWPWARR
jgi:hypothetical protein